MTIAEDILYYVPNSVFSSYNMSGTICVLIFQLQEEVVED